MWLPCAEPPKKGERAGKVNASEPEMGLGLMCFLGFRCFTLWGVVAHDADAVLARRLMQEEILYSYTRLRKTSDRPVTACV